MTCGIYQIRCVVSGRSYVGSSKNIQLRFKHHRNDLRRGAHHNFKLQAAWDKHGSEAFEYNIIEVCEAFELIQREEAHIRELNSFKDGYNCSQMGSGASPETVKLIVAANKRRRGVSCGKGIPKGPEHRLSISEAVSRAYREGRGPTPAAIRAGIARKNQS